MSIFSNIGKFIRRAIPKEVGSIAQIASLIPGPIGAIGRVVGAISTTRDVAGAFERGLQLPTINNSSSAWTPANIGASNMTLVGLPGVINTVGAVVRSLPGVGRVIGGAVGRVARSPAARRLGTAIGVGAAAGAIYDAAGNLIGNRKKYRRVNPMNYRAAMRAVRRIKGARKALQRIERTLPKRATSSAARCAPKRAAC